MVAGLSSMLHRALILLGTAYLIAAMAMVLLVCIALFFLWLALREYQAWRHPRALRCPETDRTAMVQVDPLRACLTSFLDHPALRVRACSEWPEHRNCEGACLRGLDLPRAI
jgi:hypothetical protein